MRYLPHHNLLIAPLAAVLCLFVSSNATAQTPAGSVIHNQASATFFDASGAERSVSSNSVETLIQQVAGVTITQDQSRLVVTRTEVVFPHVISNSGNGPDSYSLSALNAAGNDFNLRNIAIFADTNQDGIADNSTRLTTTPTLSAGEDFPIVVRARVPGAANVDETADLIVTATSTLSASIDAFNVDTAIVTESAVIHVTKSISALNGASPSGPYTVTLNYTNPTRSTASDIVLIDALPAGMSYVPGSARWSETGGTVLTDSDAADVQGSGNDTIVYCAYHSDCVGLPEATLDADSVSTNQVTAVISEVRRRRGGSVSFEITVDSDLLAGNLTNTGEFEFTNNVGSSGRQFSNPVQFTVDQRFAVVLNGSSVQPLEGLDEPVVVNQIAQNQSVDFDNVVWNSGNGDDTFDLTLDIDAMTFPVGTVFQLLHADGQTQLVDTNGNGIADTGTLAAGDFLSVIVRATPPAAASGDNGGAGFEIVMSAQSIGATAQTSSVLNRLALITQAGVDITNQAALGSSDATGQGIGPEGAPVSSHSVLPGSHTEFVLYVNNISAVADEYALAVSVSESFADTTLPAGWSVQFFAPGTNSPLASTGVIAPGAAQAVIARITVDSNQSPMAQSLYFRALSETTGASDIKHDEVVVQRLDSIELEPAQQRQTEPGGVQVYPHYLTNNGNATVSAIALSITNSLQAEGWSTTLYQDSDDNGVLDGSDPMIDTVTTLAAGETLRLFLRVYAPATAAQGTINTSTLTATWNAGSVSVVDITTVTEGEMTILKEQAMDTGCDDVLDSAFNVTTFALPPGNNCVHYRLTATNQGVVPLYNAVIEDATPAFTTYRPTASCSAAACTITEPAAGATGAIAAQISTILPGESVELSFAVVLE